MKKIRITVEFGHAGISAIEEYYDLPDDWDQMAAGAQQRLLEEMGAEELSNAGVGYAASVVDVEDGAE